jgi:hypothetical protein
MTDEPDTEEWRPIAGYEPLYEISSLGRVRSIGTGKGRKTGACLKATHSTRGYLQVRLCKDGAGKTFAIHTLVAAAFIGPRPPGRDVLHSDGNQANNASRNLRYGTVSENIADAKRHGTFRSVRGAAHGHARLDADAVLNIRLRKMPAAGYAKFYGVATSTIYSIWCGANWKHVACSAAAGEFGK